ncbi:NADH-quinone oxidoreductase subunit NuoG [Burkholderiaceae bacterium DAT-1]|nr:NADH-quinone oxidoreductase subunit NuoG [Burkholderiaceae bacterium DAT-1]
MLEIEIDGKKLTVPDGSTVIEAARANGTYIPHFCYHKKLSIAANCRMCLVQVEKAPKPLPACATPVTDGMKVFTHSDMAVKAQQGVMEFLLINHPLDCPICDQGGECQLQDLAVGYGGSASRYEEDKRVVSNKDLGPLISTDMTRCIHCTRCVRFTEEIAGLQEIGMAHRGEHSEIMSFVGMTVDSEISGNVIDLCPVGALTSKPFRYTARTWELSRRKSVSPHDGLGANLVVQVKQNRVMRVLPLENESVNECWIADRDRFSYEALNSADRLQKPMLKQGGQWIETDWQTALEYVANGLKSVVRDHGADSVAAVGSAHSTIEELFLLNKLVRGGLGVDAVDTRGRESDSRLASAQAGVSWLGQTISSLAASSAVLVVGSNLRKEQPLIAQRLRHTVKHGGKLSILALADDNLLCKVENKLIVRADQLVESLASVVKAAAEIKGAILPAGVESAHVSDTARRIAQSLIEAAQTEGKHASVVFGNLAANHPRAAELAVLGNQLSELTGATFGWMSAAANTVGAQIVSLSKQPAAFAKARKAFVLFGAEAIDAANTAQAQTALSQAEMVVVASPFKHSLDVADVLLPIAPFSETAGTFVNMEGLPQSFNGVVKPLGDTRPGWKVLRVLGNLLGLNGFDYETAEAVRVEALPQGADSVKSLLNNAVNSVGIQLNATSGLVRLGEVPIYQSDALVRRAPSLQATKDAAAPVVGVSASTAATLGLKDGQQVRVKQDGEVVLPLVIDTTLPEGVVRVAAGHPATAVLGAAFGNLTVAGA